MINYHFIFSLITVAFWMACGSSKKIVNNNGMQETASEIHNLSLGDVVSRSIQGGVAHLFELKIEAGHYFHIEAIQYNIDLKLVLHLPGSDSTLIFDSPSGLLGSEHVYHFSEEAGTYQLEVTPLSAYAERGSYRLEIKAQRPATTEDLKWLKVYDARRAADVLRSGRATREKSVAAYEAVIGQWMEIDDPYQVADATRALGFALRSLGQNERAIDTFISLLPRWRNLGEIRSEAFTYIILAGFFKNKKEFDKALELSFLAVEKWHQAGDLVQETKAFADIASFYMMVGQHQKAKDYYEKTLEMARATGSNSLLGTIYREHGNAWQTLGDENAVIEYYSQALTLYRKMSHWPAEAQVATLLGDFMAEKGYRRKARYYYKQALSIWKKLGIDSQITNVSKKIKSL